MQDTHGHNQEGQDIGLKQVSAGGSGSSEEAGCCMLRTRSLCS